MIVGLLSSPIKRYLVGFIMWDASPPCLFMHHMLQWHTGCVVVAHWLCVLGILPGIIVSSGCFLDISW